MGFYLSFPGTVPLSVNNGEIASAKAVFGGIATKPWRGSHLKSHLNGEPLRNNLLDQTMQQELLNAKPLSIMDIKRSRLWASPDSLYNYSYLDFASLSEIQSHTIGKAMDGASCVQ